MSGYHTLVSRYLTATVRAGGSVETGAGGIGVCGPAERDGPYEIMYFIGPDGYLFRRQSDEYGRVLENARAQTIKHVPEASPPFTIDWQVLS